MRRAPPGPKGLLATLRLLQRIGNDPLGSLLHLTRTYGDLVMLRLGPVRLCLVNHPDIVREVFVSQAKSFRRPKRLTSNLAQVIGNGLLTNEGEGWLRQRRLVQPAFNLRRFEGYAETTVNRTQRLMETWTKDPVINIADAMGELTLTIIGQALFDADIAEQAPQLRGAVRDISRALARAARQPIPIPDWLPLPGKLRKRRAQRLVDEFIWTIIRERRASGEDRGDLLSMLLLAVDEETDGTGMTDEQVRDEALTLLLAGHDSTAAALAWTWYLIAQNSHVETKLLEELDTVLVGRLPTFSDLPQLAYTEAVIKESLRLYPPNWGTMPRQAITDVQLGEYALPKGSLVLVSPYVMHHDPRSFPDPERFDPDRFSAERIEMIPQYAYIPFGAGPRVCIGDHFAMMTMKVAVATILQRYHLGLIPDKPHVAIEPLLVLRPKGGLYLEISQRASTIRAV